MCGVIMHTHTLAHKYTLARIHTYTLAHIHIHTYIHTYTHTHTHVHTQSEKISWVTPVKNVRVSLTTRYKTK